MKAIAHRWVKHQRRGCFLLWVILVAFFFVQVPCSAFPPQDNPTGHKDTPTSAKVSNILEKIPDKPVNENDLTVAPEVLEKHNAWKLEFERKIYEWQFTTSKLVFVIVICMVLVGLYFSWMHFEANLRPQRKSRRKKSVDPANLPDQEVAKPDLTQLEAYGVKLSTPVFGVVILGVSFAFFYLYLQFVYPIK
jgi:hypothetical protein